MDPETLVDKQIEERRKLVEELSAGGYEMGAAFWMRRNDDGEWRFYIVSPLVDSIGLQASYGRLREAKERGGKPFSGASSGVFLLGPSDPLGKDVLAIYAGPFGPREEVVYWNGIWLGKASIDGAYFYPLPTAATV